jgi:ADP-ribose pyrophosphatase YjhB (NUDIX family)
MIEKESCPNCGNVTERYKNPYPTADVIVEIGGKIVLIKRKNPPAGWAIPGGFIDYGESAEDAAVREIREETGLEITGMKQFHTYSAPDRDPRFHTLTVVFTAISTGTPVAGDDAAEAALFDRDNLPSPLAFDHEQVLRDYFESADRQ